LILAIVIGTIMKSAAKSGEKEKKRSAAERTEDMPKPQKAPGAPKTAVPISAVRAQKRAQAARAEEWRAAKRQQDDAQQLHSVGMDSCEGKLESLRVLYEAGILDREEYAQRVSRVKAKHHGA